MRDINFYLDATKKGLKIESDRELSRHFGYTTSWVNQLRKNRMFPSESTMLVMAKHAGISPEKAFVDLNIWRAPNEAKPFYKKMSRLVCSVGFLAILTISSYSYEANKLKYNDSEIPAGKLSEMFYIMENIVYWVLALMLILLINQLLTNSN